VYHVIVNPAAGNGRTLKVRRLVERELRQRALAFQVYLTERPGHATDISRKIASGGGEPRVLIVGGDGTFNEVANGLAGSDAIVYFASCGTGNDFVKALNLPPDPIKALRAQLSSPPRAIDAGMINERLFLNISGTGFDIEVLRQAQRYRARFKGLAAYLLGIFSALRHFRPVEVQITLGGKTFTRKLTLFEVANGRYFGGGMLVAPSADPTDGLFDVVYVDAISPSKIPMLLPAFVAGKFLSLPIVHTLRADEVVIESPGMTVNLDGELMQVNRAHFKILPGALRIACP
jgi:diacylglycerol kinase (ATP)